MFEIHRLKTACIFKTVLFNLYSTSNLCKNLVDILFTKIVHVFTNIFYLVFDNGLFSDFSDTFALFPGLHASCQHFLIFI